MKKMQGARRKGHAKTTARSIRTISSGGSVTAVILDRYMGFGLAMRIRRAASCDSKDVSGRRRRIPHRADATERAQLEFRKTSAPKRKSLPREEVRQAFRKEPNSGWEEECRRSYRRPWEEEWAV
jgi:hypothetical protein|nr:hypothetical protein [Neorhizobium tomejilense]